MGVAIDIDNVETEVDLSSIDASEEGPDEHVLQGKKIWEFLELFSTIALALCCKNGEGPIVDSLDCFVS